MDLKVLLFIFPFFQEFAIVEHCPQATKTVGTPGTNAKLQYRQTPSKPYAENPGYMRPSETEQRLAPFCWSLQILRLY